MPTAGVTGGSTMPREAHRPYRFGMTLLCFGGLLNWVGLFENYTEPVRYIGVTCVVSGAILLCFAICCWLRPGAHRENAWGQAHQHANPALQRDPVHFITLERSSSSSAGQSKPPDYDSVTDRPPSYDDAIKLSPALLWLANEHERHEGELLDQGGTQAVPKDGNEEELAVSEVDDEPLPPPPLLPSSSGGASSASSPGGEGGLRAGRASVRPACSDDDAEREHRPSCSSSPSSSSSSASSSGCYATPPSEAADELPSTPSGAVRK